MLKTQSIAMPQTTKNKKEPSLMTKVKPKNLFITSTLAHKPQSSFGGNKSLTPKHSQ